MSRAQDIYARAHAWAEAAKVSGEGARSFSEYVATAVRVIIDRAYPAYEFARDSTNSRALLERGRGGEVLSTETSFWHPYADMGSVRHSEHVMERAEDVWVWDTDGNRYLDATAGLWYANVGHGRPEIRAAVAAQMERLEACSAFFDLANPPVLELAEALAERAPMPAKVFFGSGGSDGIDTAAKLARRYWWEVGERDRTVLISRTAAYHGTHGFGTALGGIPSNQVGFGPLNETIQVRHDSLEEMEQTFARIGAGASGGGVHGTGDRRRRRVPTGPWIHRRRRRPVPANRRAPRRGCSDLRFRSPRHMVRDRALGRGAGHDRVRQGRDQRLSPARRRHDLRADRRAVLAGARRANLPARLDVCRPSHVLRRCAREYCACSSATVCSNADANRSRRCSMPSRRLPRTNSSRKSGAAWERWPPSQLTAEVCERQPRVAASLALGARAAGIFVRPGRYGRRGVAATDGRSRALRDDC